MQLSLALPYSLTSVLLLVSNLLQWENVCLAQVHNSGTADGESSLKDLLDNALKLNYHINDLNKDMNQLFANSDFSSKMYHEFMLMFYKDTDFMGNAFSVCHNFSHYAPASLDEAKMFSVEDFLKVIHIQLGTWKYTLQYLVIELSAMPGAPDEILAKAKGIEAKNKELLEVIRQIAKKADPGTEGDKDHTVWLEKSYLQKDGDQSQLFAVFKLYECLGVDTYSLELYLKLLMCRLFPDKTCNSLGLRDGIYDSFF